MRILRIYLDGAYGTGKSTTARVMALGGALYVPEPMAYWRTLFDTDTVAGIYDAQTRKQNGSLSEEDAALVTAQHQAAFATPYLLLHTRLVPLFGPAVDGTHISSAMRLRAIQQLARNVQAVLDSFERGTADQMLRVLMEKAPPLSLLAPFTLYEGRLADRVACAALVSELKRRVRDDTFFLTKHERNKDAVLDRLSDLVNCTAPSVAVARMTHADTQGRPVDGVLVTTAGVRQRLLHHVLTLADTHADVPVTYGEMVIANTNLVTALVMGKAVSNMDDVARYLLGGETAPDDGKPVGSARVRADLVVVGDRLVFLEALEKRVYQATQVPYPLVGNLDVTFVMPLGVFKPAADRYARHAGSFAPTPGLPDPRTHPPRAVHFFNKDGVPCHVTFEHAMGTLCHPSFLDVDATLAALRQEPAEVQCAFGAYVADARPDALVGLMQRFLEEWPGMMPVRPRGPRQRPPPAGMTPRRSGTARRVRRSDPRGGPRRPRSGRRT